MEKFLDALRQIIADNQIICEPDKKHSYEVDWRKQFHATSVAVVFPTITTQIQDIIQLCLTHGVKITPQGGNTSKCGGAVPNDNSQPHIILNLAKMNNILDFNAANKSICVEAGCTLAQIQDFVKKHNLYFPLQLTSAESCQIGGNIATNAGGINVLKYGMMRDMVLGLEVVLPNGSIVNQLKCLRKDNTYIDLKQLFIGSEGTLGIISKATLKLYHRPQHTITCLFTANSIKDCINIMSTIENNNQNLTAFEIINQTAQDIYNKYYDAISIRANWLILAEMVFYNEQQLNESYVLIDQLTNSQKPIIATNSKERQQLWLIRKNIPHAEKLFGKALKYDISLPLDKIDSFISDNYAAIKSYLTNENIIIFGHLGDGNLHYNIPMSHIKDNTNIELLTQIVYTTVNKFGGSISAEHGIGQLKNKWFKMFSDSSSYELATSIKSFIDPTNLLNPGKIFND